MPDDFGALFRMLSVEERFRLALKPEHRTELLGYLGAPAFEEMFALASSAERILDDQHLARGAPKDLLFVPGVMGSLLSSRTLGGLWWIDIGRDLGRLKDLRLDQTGEQDFNPDFEVFALQIDMHYTPFLTAALKHPEIGYDVFFYDWRKSPRLSSKYFLEKVRSLFLTNEGRPVNIIAHSMGGLVVRTALMKYGEELWPMLGRLVFIGTPHYGSPVIAGYLKNHLGGSLQLLALGKLIGRTEFRSLWGPLSMLPAPIGVYPGTQGHSDPNSHPCADFDLYDAAKWKLKITPDEASDLQRILDHSRELHHALSRSHSSLSTRQLNHIAVIAGVGQRTLFSVSNRSGFTGQWEKLFPDIERDSSNPHREGDGRVPLASASLEDVGECRFVRGTHDALPNTRAVYDDAFRWVRREEMRLPKTVNAALGQHLAATNHGSEAPHLDGSSQANMTSDDPGYLDFSPMDGEELTAFEEELWAEEHPEFKSVRIL